MKNKQNNLCKMREKKEASLCRYDFKMLKSTVLGTLVQMSTNNFGSPIKECVHVLLDKRYGT
jgi:hypothetical protein